MKFDDERLPTDFWSRITPEPMSGCWLWVAGQTKAGYGQLRHKYTHRISYAAAKGPIPDGLHIDHLCRVVSCCNPDHLEAVTCGENIRRGMKGSLRKACKRGHAYTPDNTWRHKNGNRYCRTCKLATNNARYHAKKLDELEATYP